ncbi:MAG: DUF5317 domain-containing protein [Sporichthyaceae bacterium]
MGLTLLVLIAALAIGWFAGTPGGRVTRVGICGVPLLLTALLVLVGESVMARQIPYSYPISFAVAATLMIQFAARNLAVPGVALAVAGVLANATVILANGAMPVSVSAAQRAGVPIDVLELQSERRHEPLDGATRLPLLADRIPVPVPGHREVDSVGDLALAAGVGLFAFGAVHRRRESSEVPLGTMMR